ncbi:MAG TPA: 16S rRNA (cytosine(1402)-N(4))-methyltransferase RsmH, partial [Rectinemataceae bacterium]
PGKLAADFILFDFGISMHQLKGSNRGFSFSADEPLDMRMSPGLERSAADIIATAREEELADLIFRFGEERLSRRIARAICEARRRSRIAGTAALASIVASAVPASYRHGRIHPATRTFQALRIAVNDELGRIERALPLAAGLLSEGGVVAIIAFHSLEDRISKRFCRAMAQDGFEELYRSPRVPGEAEIAANPASRSAKLRALRRPSRGIDPASGKSQGRGEVR